MIRPLSTATLSLPCVDLRLWQLDLDSAEISDPQEWLSASECARAARFVFNRDAQRYRQAHIGLRRLLAQELKVPPRTEFVTAAQGKPGLRRDEPMGFNLSHSGAHGLVGLSQQMAIGVDLEQRIDLPDVWALAEEHFSIDEQQQLKALPSDQVVTAFLRAWTRKEACLKALGCGLLLPASGLEAGLAPQPRRLWVEHEFQRHELWVESIPQPQGILAAVACVVPFGPPMSVTA